MQRIPLSVIPNQSFSVRLEGHLYRLTLQAGNQIMYATIERDGEVLISGQRCMHNIYLIPYRYLEGSNFVFTTVDNNYPWWENFEDSQKLYYLTDDELSEVRDGY